MGKFGQSMVSFAQLKMAETVGEGTFGVVWKATLVNNIPVTGDTIVAVKVARNISSKQELRSLLNESLLMKEFDHPNIVGLLGVSFDTPEGYPYLILPFMINGNIRDYLKDKRVQSTNTAVLLKGFSTKTLVTMCVDVAKGMEYLSSNKFVHRDLAERNCMLDEKGVVRVGDFGLARDVYSHLYYRADKFSQIPVKWSAPEVLKDGLCTEYSDVWSYGVVCWEVFSLGSTPYPGVSNHNIHQYVVSGRRLKKPPLCRRNMYAIMKSCWKLRPEERPNFKQLVSSITTP
jgi:serine/threonine protein kinase